MRDNSFDRTIERNYIQKWQFLMAEYELVKNKQHDKFKTVGAFYKYHNTCSQTFRKYYNRYLQSGKEVDLLPQKRGPKWLTRRTPENIEKMVVKHRKLGNNRYDIYNILQEELHDKTPSLSTIYRVCKRHNLGRLNKKMVEEKRMIIKKKAGELGHVDCHYLSRDLFLEPTKKKYYVVCVVDSCTRLAWAEIADNLKSLTVMFRTLSILNTLNNRYNIQFEEILSDNGSEFASRKNKDGHAFERMLLEMGIKHRYTRPYRPQTNGKVERFWRTLEDDLLRDATYENLAELKEQLSLYLIYYNEHRSHQGHGMDGKTPLDKNNKLMKK